MFFVSSLRPTSGGVVTVTGTNFGQDSAAASLVIGSTECSSPTKLLSHTAITCTLSPLSALPSFDLSVRLPTPNRNTFLPTKSHCSKGAHHHQQPNWNHLIILLRHSLPRLHQHHSTHQWRRYSNMSALFLLHTHIVSRCLGPVSGSNFGALYPPSSVTIGSSSCASPSLITPHLAFACTMPALSDYPASALPVSALFGTRRGACFPSSLHNNAFLSPFFTAQHTV